MTLNLDAPGRTLEQIDVAQEYIHYSDKNNDLSLQQPLIVCKVRLKYDAGIVLHSFFHLRQQPYMPNEV